MNENACTGMKIKNCIRITGRFILLGIGLMSSLYAQEEITDYESNPLIRGFYPDVQVDHFEQYKQYEVGGVVTDRGKFIYTVWQRASANYFYPFSTLYFSKSTDSGRTWTQEVEISEYNSQFRYNQESSLAIDSRGGLHIAFVNADMARYLGDWYTIFYMSSTDRGCSWQRNQIMGHIRAHVASPKIAVYEGDEHLFQI